MKILSIIEALGRGGAEVALADLVAEMPEHRHVVWHFTSANRLAINRNHVRRLSARGVRVRDVHWRAVVSPTLRDEMLEGFEPDVVVFHWWRNEPWAPWIADALPSAKRPWFVCVLHSALSTVSSAYDRYVIVAELQRSLIHPAPDSEVWLIPNAVDGRRFRAASRASRSGPGEKFVIGSLARLHPEKMPLDSISRAVAWDVPHAVWRFAGDGLLRAPFEAQAAAARSGEFHFVGHIARRAVPRFLSELDVLCHVVHPDTLDSNPIAVIEALAAGVPVVAEARGGLPDLIEDGTNGLLAADLDEIGTLLSRLEADRGLVRRLSRGARESAVRFGRDEHLAAYRRLLAPLEAGPPPAASDAAIAAGAGA